MGFAQAQVFGTPTVTQTPDCPEPIVCDTPEEVTENNIPLLILIGISFLLGILIGITIKDYGKNLFSKRKKDKYLDLGDKTTTDKMFENATKAVEEAKAQKQIKQEEETGTSFRW